MISIIFDLKIPEPKPYITLSDVKQYLAINYNDHDELLQDILINSQLEVERYTKRLIGQRDIELWADEFYTIKLPYAPYVSITSVDLVSKITNVSTSQTENTDFFVRGGEFARIIPAAEITGYYVKVVYKAGMEKPPLVFKHAILHLCDYYYNLKANVKLDKHEIKKDLSMLDAYKPFR
jgi:hypothetical protein